MKNVTTGVVLPLTDGVIDYIADSMSDAQRKETLRRTMRELRDAEAAIARLRGTAVSSGRMPPPGAPVQIVINARRGPGGDRWIVDEPWPSIIRDEFVVAWRPVEAAGTEAGHGDA